MTQKLTDNTKLADKISKLTGMSATSACQGFKNLGQCVAAAHVAKNLTTSSVSIYTSITYNPLVLLLFRFQKPEKQP
jgi:hypothetical protein